MLIIFLLSVFCVLLEELLNPFPKCLHHFKFPSAMCEGPNFNFTPQYLHKKNEKLSSNQNLYMSGHSSVIHHSQKVGNLNVY